MHLPKTKIRKEYRFELQQRQFNSIKWLLRFSQFVGAAPVNLSFIHRKSSEKMPIYLGKIKQFLHHIWCTFILCCMLFSIYTRSAEAFAREYSVNTLLDPIEYMFSLVKCLLVITGCYCQRQQYAAFFNNFIDIDIRIQQTGGITFASTLNRFCWRIGLQWMTFNACAIVLDILFRKGIVYNIMRSLFVYVIPNIIFTAAILQYLCLLYALRQRFGQINYVLNRLLNENDDGDWADEPSKCCGLAVMLLNYDANELNDVKGKYTRDRKHKAIVKVRMSEILNSLRIIFQDLIEINYRVSDTFGLLVLILAMASFMSICSQLYFFYNFAKGTEALNAMRTIYCAMWVILHGARLWLILYCNTKVEDEVS